MEKTTKVEFRELANSVTASVDVEIVKTAGTLDELTLKAEEEALKQAIELFDKAQKYSALKTMEKQRL